MISLLKKHSAKLLLFTFFFVTCLTLSSCGLFKDNSSIFIVSEESFEDLVKINDSGEVKEINRKKLQKADIEDLVTGEKYYAVLFADGKKISCGWLKFYSDITINTDVYSGTKNGKTLDVSVSYPSASNPTASGLAHTSIEVEVSKTGKTDFYVAFGFTPNAADEESFKVNFQFYEGSHNNDFSVYKKILYNKQITSESSVKYLSYEDYMSGSYDEKLKDSMEVALGQKCYAVIEYKLSEFKEIEETDVAKVSIFVASENGAEFILRVEEFPTADYNESNTTAEARFKLNDGVKRFIVSITAKKAGKIDITAKISGDKMSILSSTGVSSSFTVNPRLTVDSKLSYTLSADGKHYIVTGLGEETGEVIIIPSNYKGLPVKEIAANTFSNSAQIREVILPDTLVIIGAEAFENCTGLEKVIIPLSVTVIGDEAFAGCSVMDIYCEAKELPDGWSDTWVDYAAIVNFGYVNK